MLLRSTSSYTRELKASLPAEAFEPALSRLLWLPVHIAVIGLGFTLLAQGMVPWALAVLVSLPIGLSFAGLTFLAHEVLHGAIVRDRVLRRVIGGICFAPFMISARLWIAWHNRVHHDNTNNPGMDPDAYPSMAEYEERRVVRILTDHLGPGGGRLNGLLSLLIGFSVQSGHMLLRARSRGYLSPRQHTIALIESGLALSLWVSLAWIVGWLPFLFAFVIPLAIANAVVMGFILTNHSLSPHADVNDPLFNSLSVTAPRWVEWVTLRFGYHVEHHLFPWMSSRHAPAVRTLIQRHWPERYQSMSLLRALLKIHNTGRVYKNATTLADLPGGTEWRTLLPREVATAPLARERLAPVVHTPRYAAPAMVVSSATTDGSAIAMPATENP